MRRMLVSRSSLLKPKPLLRLVRTSSPSRTSTCLPSALSRGVSASVSVDFPAPDMPVNQRVNPLSILLQLLQRNGGGLYTPIRAWTTPVRTEVRKSQSSLLRRTERARGIVGYELGGELQSRELVGK